MLDGPILKEGSKFWLNRVDSWVTVFNEQSVGLTGSVRSRDCMHLVVILAILALTHIGDHFGFMATLVLCSGMRCR